MHPTTAKCVTQVKYVYCAYLNNTLQYKHIFKPYTIIVWRRACRTTHSQTHCTQPYTHRKQLLSFFSNISWPITHLARSLRREIIIFKKKKKPITTR